MQGIIIKITDKGFGFISIEGQPKNVFFHGRSLVDITFAELREGDMVSFETEETRHGLNAINVRRIDA